MAHDMDTDLTVEQARAHILIVDDDERIRGLLQKFLIQHGYWASVARGCGACSAFAGGCAV